MKKVEINLIITILFFIDYINKIQNEFWVSICKQIVINSLTKKYRNSMKIHNLELIICKVILNQEKVL